jgi:hypothetical protein
MTDVNDVPICTCFDDWHANNAGNHALTCPVIAAFATLTRERDEARRDAARWRFYCCPQTALMLGSNCDPNDDSIDWRAEINRLADERIAALTQEDA